MINYFSDLGILDEEAIAAVLGDPISSMLTMAVDTRGMLAASVAGHLNQTDTLINFSAIDPALGLEEVSLHGTEWYAVGGLQGEADLASGAAKISLSSLNHGDQIGFSSPYYTLTETSNSITVIPGVASANDIVVPVGITAVSIDHAEVGAVSGFAAPAVTLDLSSAANVTITGWRTGDHLVLATASQGYAAMIAIQSTGRFGPLDTSASHIAAMVELGAVTADTAAAVASVANADYVPSSTLADAKGIFFEAQTSAGTTVYAFHGAAHGIITGTDLTHVATLVGVQSIGTNDIALG